MSPSRRESGSLPLALPPHHHHPTSSTINTQTAAIDQKDKEGEEKREESGVSPPLSFYDPPITFVTDALLPPYQKSIQHFPCMSLAEIVKQVYGSLSVWLAPTIISACVDPRETFGGRQRKKVANGSASGHTRHGNLAISSRKPRDATNFSPPLVKTKKLLALTFSLWGSSFFFLSLFLRRLEGAPFQTTAIIFMA